jgi:ribonuclease P protein component
VIVLPKPEGSNRLGISVQKKTGKAVRRNRIKRLVRETFRINRDLFPACSDIVVTIRPGFDMNSLSALQASMKEILGFQHSRGPLV